MTEPTKEVKLRPVRGVRRRWFKPIRERNPIFVAFIGFIVLAAMVLAALNADDLPIIGGGTTYTAQFTEAAGAQAGDEVRIAGVKVGKITAVELAGDHVDIEFRVKDAWVGDASTVAIMIKTVLGAKYLQVDPLGADPQNPGRPIPANRTLTPYDVTEAFDDLSATYEDIDSAALAQSLDVLADTFKGTPPHIKKAFTGLSGLSKTISSRDAELKKLLSGTRKVSKTLADQNQTFEDLIKDGNLLLGELIKRRQAIHRLLVETQRLAKAIRRFIKAHDPILFGTLKSVEKVAGVLVRHQKNLDRALKLSGPYIRLVGNTVGNGRWVDGYLCGVTPNEYLERGAHTPPATGCRPTRKGAR